MNQEQSCPQGFVVHVYERNFHYPMDKISSVWKKLQRRETLTKGQLFPYRVEFAASSQEGELFTMDPFSVFTAQSGK